MKTAKQLNFDEFIDKKINIDFSTINEYEKLFEFFLSEIQKNYSEREDSKIQLIKSSIQMTSLLLEIKHNTEIKLIVPFECIGFILKNKHNEKKDIYDQYLEDLNDKLDAKTFLNEFKTLIQEILSNEKIKIVSDQDGIKALLKYKDVQVTLIPLIVLTADNNDYEYCYTPDEIGSWKKTNLISHLLKIDSLTKSYSLDILEFIRILKYWNTVHNLNIPSTFVEEMVLDYIETSYISPLRRFELTYFFDFLNKFLDEKTYELNNLNKDYRKLDLKKIQNIAQKSKDSILRSIRFEQDNQHNLAENEWNIVFNNNYNKLF